MKCREKNSEKTFLKVENAEAFWEQLKEAKVKVVMINEKGIIVSDSAFKLFAEFGEYLIVSKDGFIEICGEEEFNRRYNVIGNTENFDVKLNELRRLIENFDSEMKKIKHAAPKINLSFEDLKGTEDVNKILKNIVKISDIFNFAE